MRLLSGGCSRVEYQRIRCLSLVVSMPVRCPLGVPGTCGRGRGGSSFGTLLGPEATGPYFFRAMRKDGGLVGLCCSCACRGSLFGRGLFGVLSGGGLFRG